jgi:small subunit ribosomal protein S21
MAYKRNNKRNYRGYDDKRGNKKTEKKTAIGGRRPSHVTVVPRKNEDPNRTIKRFLKKCKNEKIVEKIREKAYYVKPSERRRKERIRRKRTIQKANSAQD